MFCSSSPHEGHQDPEDSSQFTHQSKTVTISCHQGEAGHDHTGRKTGCLQFQERLKATKALQIVFIHIKDVA